jgi:hypothetical protein
MPLPSAEGLAAVLRRSGIGAHPLQWRLPPIETYPRVVAFAQTPVGKLVLFLSFGALLKPLMDELWLATILAAALVSLAGRYRFHAALLATGALLLLDPAWFDFRAAFYVAREQVLLDTLDARHLHHGTLVAGVLLAAAAMYLARRFRNHPLGRRPVLAEHLLYFCLIGLATSKLLQGVPLLLLWSLIAVFSAYFWFLAYALMDMRQRQPTPLLLQFATFHPFFGSTTVPMGKGAANWRSVDSASAEALAVTQLKGLKLLVWTWVLSGLLWAMREVVYVELGIPSLKVTFGEFQAFGRVIRPMPLGLLSVVANFAEHLLNIAIFGHVIIATARLAGFRLLRNTFRPLTARTIAEFWNRLFYYFKEVLVNIYFYPTYLRWFKRHPRLRIAFATFMAAGVGNFFFHFMLLEQVIAEEGPLEAMLQLQSYAFYCFALATGIIISQLRDHKPDPAAGWWRRQFLPSLGVAVFFCFLSFFDGPQRHVPLMQNFQFLFQVLGVDRWIPLTA